MKPVDRKKQQRKPQEAKPLEKSTGKLKKKIRDTERMLSKDTLSGPIRTNMERQLIHFKYLYGECVIDERERAMQKQYHGIKHIERTKLNRKMTQVRREISEAEDDATRNKAKQKLKELGLDLIYIDNFPKTLPYASLYGASEDEKRAKKKDGLRDEIRRAHESNTLDDLQQKYRKLWRKRLIKEKTIEDAHPIEQQDDAAAPTASLKDEFFE
ncbi:hypothetical protein BC940DRAFT_307018 [Gongronella butleri]|nr:hypothetical protein BC940DRAFT_307018 [Gongronella butleri]